MTTDVRLTAEVDVLIRDAIELRCANEPDEQSNGLKPGRPVPSGSSSAGEGVAGSLSTPPVLL
jgi:hypothetical protein